MAADLFYRLNLACDESASRKILLVHKFYMIFCKSKSLALYSLLCIIKPSFSSGILYINNENFADFRIKNQGLGSWIGNIFGISTKPTAATRKINPKISIFGKICVLTFFENIISNYTYYRHKKADNNANIKNPLRVGKYLVQNTPTDNSGQIRNEYQSCNFYHSGSNHH